MTIFDLYNHFYGLRELANPEDIKALSAARSVTMDVSTTPPPDNAPADSKWRFLIGMLRLTNALKYARREFAESSAIEFEARLMENARVAIQD